MIRTVFKVMMHASLLQIARVRSGVRPVTIPVRSVSMVECVMTCLETVSALQDSWGNTVKQVCTLPSRARTGIDWACELWAVHTVVLFTVEHFPPFSQPFHEKRYKNSSYFSGPSTKSQTTCWYSTSSSWSWARQMKAWGIQIRTCEFVFVDLQPAEKECLVETARSRGAQAITARAFFSAYQTRTAAPVPAAGLAVAVRRVSAILCYITSACLCID